MTPAPLSVPTELVSLLPAPADPETRATLRRALARLAAVDAPHLAPLRRISEQPQGFQLTYALPPGACAWADLAARRPPTTAETVALGLALCHALGALHGAGLTHGAVTADRVLVSAGGTVELAGAGATWSPPGADAAGVALTSADDVAALAGLLSTGLAAGSIGSDLALLLVRAADPDPSVRPGAAELGAALERQCPPEPIVPEAFLSAAVTTLTPPGPVGGSGPPDGTVPTPVVRAGRPRGESGAPAPADRLLSLLTPARAEPAAPGAGATASSRPAPRRRPHGSRQVRLGRADAGRGVAAGHDRPPARRLQPLLLASAGLVGVLLLAQGVTGLAGRGTRAAPAPTAVPASPLAEAVLAGGATGAGVAAAVDWAAVVRGLDAARARALATGSATGLAAAVDPDGPAYARDLATITARRAAGLRVLGGALAVRAVVPAAVDDRLADLRRGAAPPTSLIKELVPVAGPDPPSRRASIP